MPKDSSGGFHLNFQRAHAADRMKGGAKPMGGEKPKMGMGVAVEEKPMGHEPESEGHITIHKGAEGGYHTETHDGEKMEHPTLGHALMHAANHHEPLAKHMHIKDEGMGEMESHHVGEDGEPQGPHSHENLEALKEHLGQFFNEEEHEGEGGGYGKPEHQEHGGMEGLSGL